MAQLILLVAHCMVSYYLHIA